MIPPPEGDPAPDLYREAAGLLRRLADVFDRLAAADPVPEAGPAATSFLLVVVLTMAASRAFDPRLMWSAGRGTA